MEVDADEKRPERETAAVQVSGELRGRLDQTVPEQA